MKKIHILIATLFFSINVNAQTALVWAKDIGRTTTNTDRNHVYGFEKDTSGLNYVIVGSFYNTIDFDPGAGVSNLVGSSKLSGYFAKYDVNGNYIWAKAITGTNDVSVNSITMDNSNNIYLSGYFRGTADFDPSASVSSLTCTVGIDGYFAKYDANGNLIFVKQLKGLYAGFGNGPLQEIKVDNFNNIYLTGVFSASSNDFDPGAGTSVLTAVSGSRDIFYAKYSSSGNYVYAFSYGTTNSNDEAGSISVESATGKVIVGGYASSGSGNSFAYRMLDASGNTLFTQTLGSSTVQQYSNVVEFDQLGNFYVSGTLSSGNIGSILVDFDTGAGVLNLTASQFACGFIAKYTTSNTLVWANTYAPTSQTFRALYITFDNYGNLLALCNDRSTSNFAGFTWKQITSSTGNIVSTSFIGGSSDNYCHGNVFQDKNNNILVSGEIGNSINPYTIDADPTAGTYNLSTFGGSDIFFAKYGSCVTAPSQPGAISGSNSVCASNGTSYSVASVPGATSYLWSLPSGWSGSSLTNTISVTPNSTGVFSVTALNACGSSPQKTLNVTIGATPTITVNSGSICSGSSFTISPAGANTYTISGGSAVVNPTSNTSYSVTGTSTAGCVSSSAAVSNVTVNANPTIMVNNGSICSGSSFTISPSGANTYTISGGSAVVNPTTNTSYTVTGTSTDGCVSSTPAISNVAVNALPTINAITTNTLMCTGESATITANGASTYTFNPGGAGISITVSQTVTTTYTINGADVNGCVNSSIFTQSVSICTGLVSSGKIEKGMDIFPNPNNGHFILNGIEGLVQIYNALGSLIYTHTTENEITEIDLSQHSNGIYFIRVGSLTRRIIKE